VLALSATTTSLLVVIGGLVGILVGKLWDSQSEHRKWLRDQRFETYAEFIALFHESSKQQDYSKELYQLCHPLIAKMRLLGPRRVETLGSTIESTLWYTADDWDDPKEAGWTIDRLLVDFTNAARTAVRGRISEWRETRRDLKVGLHTKKYNRQFKKWLELEHKEARPNPD